MKAQEIKQKYQEFLLENPFVYEEDKILKGYRSINQKMINEKHDEFVKSLGFKKGYVKFENDKRVNLTKIVLEILG